MLWIVFIERHGATILAFPAVGVVLLLDRVLICPQYVYVRVGL